MRRTRSRWSSPTCAASGAWCTTSRHAPSAKRWATSPTTSSAATTTSRPSPARANGSAHRARLDQLPERQRYEAAQTRRPACFVALPKDAEPDDAQAHRGEREREDEAVLEQAPGEVPEVAGDAQAAEHREHAPPEDRADQHHRHVDAAVGRLAELAARVHGRQAAPEREHAEEVQPAGIVAREARAKLDPEREQDHGEAEPDRHR